jgi:hypothetical protein
MEALTSEKAGELIRDVSGKITETRCPQDTRYPEKFAEIIQIFQRIRESFIKLKADGNTVILEVEVDSTLPSHELHLKITKDTRGLIAKAFGRGRLDTKIFAFTRTGYRTATEETLDSQRYFQGTDKRRESPYTRQSYINLSGMIGEFHGLLQKSSHLKLHAAQTAQKRGDF